MGTSRVVVPGSKQLPLSNGDWILVKTALSVGERHDSYEHMYLRNPDGSFVVSADGRLIVSPANSRIASILSYLLDWSLTDLKGEPLAIRGASPDEVKSMLRSIDEDSFTEIADLIRAHEVAITKAREEKKRSRAGGTGSNPTSASPSVVAGPSTRSEVLT